MLRYATYVLPLILKATKQGPAKNLAGRFVSAILLVLGVIFLGVAALIWLSNTFGADIAFLALGGFLILIASIMSLYSVWRRKRKRKARLPINAHKDPLIGVLPDSVKQNPVVEKLMVQISEAPIAATVSAVTIGMLISRELFED